MKNQNKLAEILTRNVQKVEENVIKYRATYNRIMMTSMISSGAATLIAGVTSSVGEAAKIGTEGWRLACIVAAVFGFISTISSGISQQRHLSDKVSEGKECLSRLKYLNTVMITGSREESEISKEYEELVVRFPELLG